MTLTSRPILFLAAAIIALPALAAAQEPVQSFDQLNVRLKPGDRIWITDAQGREIEGKIRALGPSAVMLDGDVPRKFDADAVRLVTQRTGRPIGKGAILGLAGGMAFGVIAVAASDCGTDCDDEGAWMLVAGGLFGAMGAGGGALVGALIPGRALVVYRAPVAGAEARVRLSIAPVLTPRAKGVAVSWSF
jgi:hypothetical protein